MHLLVVTGFLGSGKTTLLGCALSSGLLGRAALLVNEFGRVDIDGALLAAGVPAPRADRDDALGLPLVRLPNGCVCCEVQDDFIAAVRAIAERVRSGELSLDRIVLETSGLADPAPLLARVLGSRALREAITAVSTVTVVDGVSGLDTHAQHVEARHQVACADLLLLSKIDLIDEAQAQRWRKVLHALNPHADVVAAVHGKPVDARWLQRLVGAPRAGMHRHEHGHGHGHGEHGDHHHAAHSPGIESFHLRAPAVASRDHLQGWLSTLVLLHAERLLRLKGFVAVQGESVPLLVQAAQDGVQLAAWHAQPPRDAPVTELVAIARGMDDARQRDSLRRALLDLCSDARLVPGPAGRHA